MVDNQDTEFRRLKLDFPGLFGRRLHPIDCQNLFCEISKYSRVAHPEVGGVANRTRIKQSYRPSDRPVPLPQFPKRWGLSTEMFTRQQDTPRVVATMGSMTTNGPRALTPLSEAQAIIHGRTVR
jgi:hypothetical protein